MTNAEQKEMDQLREQLRLNRHRLEAAEKELAALKSGTAESRNIAESAEILAAERDAARAHARALADVVRCHEQGVAIPQSLISRMRETQGAIR